MMSEAEERLERTGDGAQDSLPLGDQLGWHGPTNVLSWPWRGVAVGGYCGGIVEVGCIVVGCIEVGWGY